jgi:hypothetical protein
MEGSSTSPLIGQEESSPSFNNSEEKYVETWIE